MGNTAIFYDWLVQREIENVTANDGKYIISLYWFAQEGHEK